MSIAEIERFAADLKSNETLRAEAEKHAAERQHETPIAQCVSFAGSKGYAFTADEAKEHAKSTARAAGKELTDAELDGVAGGIDDPPPVNFPLCFTDYLPVQDSPVSEVKPEGKPE